MKKEETPQAIGRVEVKGRPSDILAIERIIVKYGDNGYLMNRDIDVLIPLLRTIFS